MSQPLPTEIVETNLNDQFNDIQYDFLKEAENVSLHSGLVSNNDHTEKGVEAVNTEIEQLQKDINSLNFGKNIAINEQTNNQTLEQIEFDFDNNFMNRVR